MRSSVIWSFLSLVALSTGSLVAGCDSDAKIAKSGLGESCDSSADCDDGLNCLQGACYKSTPTPDGGGAVYATFSGERPAGPKTTRAEPLQARTALGRSSRVSMRSRQGTLNLVGNL